MSYVPWYNWSWVMIIYNCWLVLYVETPNEENDIILTLNTTITILCGKNLLKPNTKSTEEWEILYSFTVCSIGKVWKENRSTFLLKSVRTALLSHLKTALYINKTSKQIVNFFPHKMRHIFNITNYIQ